MCDNGYCPLPLFNKVFSIVEIQTSVTETHTNYKKKNRAQNFLFIVAVWSVVWITTIGSQLH